MTWTKSSTKTGSARHSHIDGEYSALIWEFRGIGTHDWMIDIHRKGVRVAYAYKPVDKWPVVAVRRLAEKLIAQQKESAR